MVTLFEWSHLNISFKKAKVLTSSYKPWFGRSLSANDTPALLAIFTNHLHYARVLLAGLTRDILFFLFQQDENQPLRQFSVALRLSNSQPPWVAGKETFPGNTPSYFVNHSTARATTHSMLRSSSENRLGTPNSNSGQLEKFWIINDRLYY